MTDITAAREAFLNMLADARRFEENVDGDEVNGKTVISIDYDLNVGHSQLEELCDILGLPSARYGESLKDRIECAIEKPWVVSKCNSDMSCDGGSCSERIPCNGQLMSDGSFVGGCGEPCSFIMESA